MAAIGQFFRLYEKLRGLRQFLFIAIAIGVAL